MSNKYNNSLKGVQVETTDSTREHLLRCLARYLISLGGDRAVRYCKLWEFGSPKGSTGQKFEAKGKRAADELRGYISKERASSAALRHRSRLEIDRQLQAGEKA